MLTIIATGFILAILILIVLAINFLLTIVVICGATMMSGLTDGHQRIVDRFAGFAMVVSAGWLIAVQIGLLIA
jgi:threonine/homoserine/homoserine lactone efflux protein